GNLPQLLEGHPLYVAIQQRHVAAIVVYRRPSAIERISPTANMTVHHTIAVSVRVKRVRQWGPNNEPCAAAIGVAIATVHVHHGIRRPFDARSLYWLDRKESWVVGVE